MYKRKHLRRLATNFIESDQDCREVVRLSPTIIQFRLALPRAQEVMLALTPTEKISTPAQEFERADEEILMWVHAAIQEAEQEATREGRPKPATLTNEEVASIVPVDPTNEDEDTEEQRARLYLQEDLNYSAWLLHRD